MFRITPKSLYAVNMVFSLFIDEILTMINDMMFSVSLQRLIASKCIRLVDRSFTGMCLYMTHECFSRYRFYNLGIHPPVTL